ncbi:TA system VapC family ribonuclease toxin [Mycobacterium riyadhense]|uniref:Ribonuclease VapC n=1 Tax=Mycobacterium riyadhense TaxID=486698 RepID=A0A1X2DHG5_9MYCO|nr:TA system VapC family ribonuclease toxin [Mycobacterium riyadhense]MCV7144880.1 PIN domain-containing protein [Mycobacterium riyadhense]ORW87578.1 ribonuclease [Mycobacterium riyadhense]VTO98094.1 Ribonuclease VapC39 [Mycobacterium riyadhense]
MTTLLDANVLISLVISDHIHHDWAEEWLSTTDVGFATCPITQGSLVRLLVREGQTAAMARKIVGSITRDARHEFWPDSLSFVDVELAGVVGHRQVTDAYLAQLARKHGGRLATFDQGLAQLHSDVAELVPTG